MPAIRVRRDSVVITIEIEASVDPPEASFFGAETNSWQEPHPNFAKQVHELELLSEGSGAPSMARAGNRRCRLTGPRARTLMIRCRARRAT
jgi:hypothetical protein